MQVHSCKGYADYCWEIARIRVRLFAGQGGLHGGPKGSQG